MSELALGQLTAVSLGLLFLFIEFLRLRNRALAVLEACRFWAFLSAAELTVWIATKGDAIERVSTVALGTILAALVINNAYGRAYRSLRDKE